MNGAKSKGSRRKARELALSALYMLEMQSGENPAGDENEIVESFLRERVNDQKVMEYAGRLVNGVRSRIEAIDEHIQEACEHWKISRIARVDRNILRLAAYEILFEDDISHQVSINEAVEIAKKYGSEESSSFVNGVLDRIKRISSPQT